jgi:hypothetical protein
MEYRNSYMCIYTVSEVLTVNLITKVRKNGKKNNVIRQIIDGDFSPEKLDAVKRIKKRRCCLLSYST